MAASSRRKFLVSILGALGAAGAGAATYPIYRYLSPPQKEAVEGRVTISRSQVGVGQAHFFQFHGHPAVVLQKSPGTFAAFSAICTHLGCIVKWVPDKEEFLCPCHGGRYSSDGKVLAGPPPKPLQSIPVALAGDNLLIG